MVSGRLGTVRQSGGAAFRALFVTAAIICALASFVTLMRTDPTAPVPDGLRVLLILNMSVLIGLGWVVLRSYLAIRRRTDRESGGRLTRRFMLLFGGVAMIPALIVSFFLWATITRGIDTWLGDRVLTLVDEIETLAEESGEEFAANFESDAQLMAVDVNNASAGFETDRERFESYLGIQAYVRNMSGAFVIDREGQILARAQNMSSTLFYARPAGDRFADADALGITSVLRQEFGYIYALLPLQEIDGAYLYLAEEVDPGLFSRLERARTAGNDYRVAEQRSQQIQQLFVIVYLQIVALALLLSVRMAQATAARMSGPISRLAIAAENVSRGVHGVAVPLPEQDDEVRDLSHSFNDMTQQLDERRRDLVSAREESEGRRQFLETLLGELSSGVIRIDREGRITLANRSAETLLQTSPLEGLLLSEVSPQIAGFLVNTETIEHAEDMALRLHTDEAVRHIRLKVATDSDQGQVLTLDDATRLISAQRQLAWRDVARRIAHEIRNPLTPIQLSTERIRRRYSDKIEDSDGVFERCLNTISRQVSDIGRMVQEFSDFARMPKPSPVRFNLSNLLQDIVFEQKVVFPDFLFETEMPDEPLHLEGDERLLGQAFTNIIKNACESLAGRPADNELTGQICVRLTQQHDRQALIMIEDDGPGFPSAMREQLLEPYVTAKAGGTGLGLAIVNRIIMDHGGTVMLAAKNADQTGAVVQITLPLTLPSPIPNRSLVEEPVA